MPRGTAKKPVERLIEIAAISAGLELEEVDALLKDAGFEGMNPTSYGMVRDTYAPKIMSNSNNSRLRDHIYSPNKMGDLPKIK